MVHQANYAAGLLFGAKPTKQPTLTSTVKIVTHCFLGKPFVADTHKQICGLYIPISIFQITELWTPNYS